MVIKCKLCGVEKETAREMHGHMMRVHSDQYIASKSEKTRGKCDLEGFTEGYKKMPRKSRRKVRFDDQNVKQNVKSKPEKKEVQLQMTETKKTELKNDRPRNFRLLNKRNQEELQAYNEGHRYIDPEDMIAYTAAEAKEEGWI